MLVLSRREVEELLDLDALIDALADAMADLSAGRAVVPNRVGAFVAEREGMLAAMPGWTPATGSLAAKLVTAVPAQRRRRAHAPGADRGLRPR